MQLPPDYHLHTLLCQHAAGTPADYARRAQKLGLSQIGFADHAPMPQADFDDWRMAADQLNEYVELVKTAQRDFPGLTIRVGLEVDYLPGFEDWVHELSVRHNWDYLIGSVHYVAGNWAIDNPNQIALWHTRELSDIWAEYFDRLTKAARTGLFDIIGHVDLPKKFGFRPQCDCTKLYEQFLGAAKERGCAIELNTAGLRKDCQEIYPASELLGLAHRHGVPIVFGSDAHAPAEVAMHFAEAVRAARTAGYTQYCEFALRRRSFAAL